MGRFKRAGPAPTWPGIRESREPHCTMTSQIDKCLQLDVHVPTFGSQSWPVLVWIKGSSSYYHTGKIVARGIIVVVVRHRLGPVGFMCSNEELVPGNGGVKDVVLALRWVRDNIVAFGGNPNSVVIAGQSFGAAMVEALILSPMSSGLFHGAIMQSGSILSPWAFNYDAASRVMALKRMLNEKDDITTVMSETDVEDLVAMSERLEMPYFPFGICVENPFKREERLLSKPPYNLLEEEGIRSVPIIIGYNNNEAYIFATILKEAQIEKRLSEEIMFLLPTELQDFGVRELNQTSEKIKGIYFKNNSYSMSSLLAFYRDVYFSNHIHRSARMHASSSPYPVYYYQFSYSGDVGLEPVEGVNKVGAAHSDELVYLFPESGRHLDGEDGKVQENLLTLWTNFMKQLNPSPNPGDPLHWKALDHRDPHLLNIDTDIAMIQYPHTAESQLWDELYEKYYTRQGRATLH